MPFHFGRRSRLARAFRGSWTLGSLIGIIAVVSVHDAMLVIVNHEVIAETEQNPIGNWLIGVNQGEVWLFVSLKLVGTAFACAAIIMIYRSRRDVGIIVAAAVAAFQLGLLLYLSLA